jgi:hypothetical protein
MLIMTKHDAQVVPVGVNMMHCNSQFVAQYSHPTNLKESLHDSWHTNMRNQKKHGRVEEEDGRLE